MEPPSYEVNDLIMTLSMYIQISASQRSCLRWKRSPDKLVRSWVQLQNKNNQRFRIFLVKQYEEPFHRLESFEFENIHAWIDLSKCSIHQIRQQGGSFLVQIEDEPEKELQWRGERQTSLLAAPGFTNMRREQLLQGLGLPRSAWPTAELDPSFGMSETSSPVVADSKQDEAAEARCLKYMDIGIHPFWSSQPVEQIESILDPSLSDGPIQPESSSSFIKKKPEKIDADHEWTTLDLTSDNVCSEVCKLLMEHDIEGDGQFRYANPREFLRWALRPPGYYQSWHIGITVKKSLVAVLFGVPATIRVRDNEAIKVAAVSFLCVHKDFRSKGLVPRMITEMVRRVNLKDIWQGCFNSDVLVATPVTTIRQRIRMLNPVKVSKNLGAAMPIKMATKLYGLPNAPVTPGFRKMVQSDVHAVTELLRGYLLEFQVAAEFRDEDVKHWLLPKNDVVDCYEVEDPETHLVTDFCSFYTVAFTFGGRKDQMKAAYSYYNVSTKTPLVQLMNDALGRITLISFTQRMPCTTRRSLKN